jgi:hypothetical protein
MSATRQAALSSSVQADFVLGALASAWLGLPDRFDPRRLFAVAAVAAGLTNASLLSVSPGSAVSISARFVTGLASDRIGKAEIAALAMAVSGTSAVLVAVTFRGSPWLTFLLVMPWGISVVPDSAQFVELVADASPQGQACTLERFCSPHEHYNVLGFQVIAEAAHPHRCVPRDGWNCMP